MSAFCISSVLQNFVCSYIECIWAGYSPNECGFIYFTAPLEVDNFKFFKNVDFKQLVFRKVGIDSSYLITFRNCVADFTSDAYNAFRSEFT